MNLNIDKLIDLINDLLSTLQEKLSPKPELVPVPVRNGQGQRPPVPRN
ncbi:hypothetical protein [Cesiribacter sp. SM1]|nr:hypothetical protein [Cesiribacter sp. SM1]